jgi:hypothetical protein
MAPVNRATQLWLSGDAYDFHSTPLGWASTVVSMVGTVRHGITPQSSPADTVRYHHLVPLTEPADDQQYAFEVDLDRGTGCKACVSACHSLNGLDEGEAWRDVGLLVSNDWRQPFQRFAVFARLAAV